MANKRISRYTEEYQRSIGKEAKDWDGISEALVNNHDWTEEGARHLVQLVRDYGEFILSHALALAVALNQEDGELGL